MSLAQRKDSMGLRGGPSTTLPLPGQSAEDPPPAVLNPTLPAPVPPQASGNLNSEQPSGLDVATGVSSTPVIPGAPGIPGGPGEAEDPSKATADESWFSKQGNNPDQWVPGVANSGPGDGSTQLEQYPQVISIHRFAPIVAQSCLRGILALVLVSLQ